jgi:hypothetical protein
MCAGSQMQCSGNPSIAKLLASENLICFPVEWSLLLLTVHNQTYCVYGVRMFVRYTNLQEHPSNGTQHKIQKAQCLRVNLP